MDTIVVKSKWNLTRMAWLVVFIILIAGLFYSFKQAEGKKLKVKKEGLTISTVVSGKFKEYIPLDGVVQPFRTVYLDAVEGGVVQGLFLEDGAIVKKGDKILQLSNTNLQLDIMQREADLFELMNHLQNTRLGYEKSRTSLLSQLADFEYSYEEASRMSGINNQLYHDQAISKKEYEESVSKLRYMGNKVFLTRQALKQDSASSMEQIRQLNSSVSRMNQNLGMMKNKLDDLTVKAPIDGKLTSLEAEIGELKNSGENLGQIDVLDAIKITASVDEYYINKVYKDQVARLNDGDRNIQLYVYKIYSNVRNGKFQVDFAFDKNEDLQHLLKKVRRGQTLQIRLEMGNEQQAILIPQGGFYQSTGGNWVYILDKAGKSAEKRAVRIGRQNPEYYEVLEGLHPQEEVITSSYEMLGNVEEIILNE